MQFVCEKEVIDIKACVQSTKSNFKKQFSLLDKSLYFPHLKMSILPHDVFKNYIYHIVNCLTTWPAKLNFGLAKIVSLNL